MTIVLNNITDETIGIIKWQGSISLILIGILVIFGGIGLVIKAMFVSFIAQNSSKDRPINLLISIDQVKLNFLYLAIYQIRLRKSQFYQMDSWRRFWDLKNFADVHLLFMKCILYSIYILHSNLQRSLVS